MLQLVLRGGPQPHQLVAMNQQLPQILLFTRRRPDPRKTSFQQQLQNQRGISAIVLLLPHFTGTNPRRIADPHIVSRRRGHLHKPLAVPRGLHPDQRRPRKLPVKSRRFSRCMVQLYFSRLPRRRFHPTNLLPTRVVITSNDPHRRLLPADSFGPPNRSIPAQRTEASFLSNQPCVFQGAGLDFPSSTMQTPQSHREGVKNSIDNKYCQCSN